jgi:zinc protease
MGGKNVMHRIIVGVTSATLLFCTFGMARGQLQNEDKDSLHPAFKVLNGSRANPSITLTELLDSYEKAVGGKEAVEKIRTVIVHEERHAETKSAGDHLFGSSVDYFKFPNKAKTVLTLPSGRKDVTGYDGKIAWYDSPSDGIQQMSPEVNALAAQQLNLLNLLHLRAAFPQMRLAGSSKVEGRDVYMVDASPESLGLHSSLFFDADTRLLIGSIAIQLAADRTLITEQIYSDFRVVNGVKFPFAVRAIEYNPQSSLEIKRTRIECNIPLRDAFFSVNSTTGEKSGR